MRTFPSFFRAHWLLTLLLSLICVGGLRAQTPVSRDVPDVYRELIDQRLTKLDDLLEGGHPESKESIDGEVLLREYLYWVDEDGKSHRIFHTVYHAHTQDGVEAMAQDRFAFDAKLTRVHLAAARTIGADGTVKEVADNAAFIERGRQENATQLYNSDHSVVVIYPDVKMGSLVETILVYEEVEQQIPGEFTTVLGFSTGWPVTHDRREIDLPTPLFEKLNQDQLGDDVPQMEIVSQMAGRTRLRWSADHLDRGFSERSEAPSSQTGPCVFLSTLPDWDAFTTWYSGVLAERSTLSDELKQQVDSWTEGLDSDEQILRALFEKAANDVRYTGLEFGFSGLRPYACNTVWDNQYGDCKDKSNLLRAMLAHKGINAYLTLVQTSHAGLVPKGVADFRRFDHAILAVELKPGKWIFCDPTIEHGRPGTLSPSSSDREVLVVVGERAQWMRTPPATGLKYHYALSLDLSDSYQITGTLESTGSGYYSISELRRHSGAGRDAALGNLHDLVGAFFPSAWAIDYQEPETDVITAPDTFTNRSYLITPSLQTDSENRIHLPFPMPRGLLYDYGHTEKRHTNYFQWPETTEITVTLRLPNHLTPASLPAPLESINPYYAARGQWTFDKATHTLAATLTNTTGRSVIPKNQVATALETTRALTTWVQAPVILEPKEPADTAADQRQTLKLPTAKGQLAYIDARFPIHGDRHARRDQLTAVRAAYPDDTATQYQVRHELAMLDFYANRFDQAITTWSELVANRPADIPDSSAHFSRYMLAQAHADNGSHDEAFAALRPLLETKGVSDYRLGWSLTCAGEFAIHGATVENADEYLRRALEIDGAHRDQANALLFVLHCFEANEEAATQWLTNALRRPLAEFEPVMRAAYTVFDEFRPEEDAQDALLLAARVIDSVCAAPAGDEIEESQNFATAYPAFFKSMHAARHANLVLGPQFQKFVASNRERLVAYAPDLDPLANASADEHKARIEKLMTADDKQIVAAIAHYVSQHPCTDLPEQLWRMAAFVSSEELKQSPATPLTPQLIALGEQIPFSNSNRWEFDFIRAKWLFHDKNWQQAIEMFQAQRAHPEFNTDFRSSSIYQEGQCHEFLGAWDKAIDCYLQLKGSHTTLPTAATAVMRAGVLQAREGRHDEALATWTLLHDVPESVITRSSAEVDLKEAIKLSKRPEALLNYWKAAEQWWQKVARRHLGACGVSVKDHRIEPYLSATAPALESAIMRSAQGNDGEAYLTALLPLIDYLRWSPNGLELIYNQFQIAAIDNNPRLKKHTNVIAQSIAGAVVDFGDPELIPYAQRLNVALLIDGGQSDQALPLARTYVEQMQRYDRNHIERLIWLYMMASVQSGENLEESSAEGLKVWQNGISQMDPHQFGNSLGWALREAGRNDDALAVAQAALQLQTNTPAYTNLLRKLVTTIQAEAKSSGELNTALLDWAQQNRPVWYDLVEAPTPDSLEFAPTAASLKFHLQLVADESAPAAQRLKAWQDAVLTIAEQEPQWAGFVDVVSQAARLEAIPATTKAQAIWRAYTYACYQGHPRAARKLRNLPAFQQLNAHILTDLSPRLMDHAAAVRYRDADQHLANIDSLTQVDEIDDALRELISTELRGLWILGEVEAAEEVIKSVKSWKLSDDSFTFKLGLQMGLRKASHQLQHEMALADEWTTLLQPQLELAATKAPRDWREWRSRTTMHSGLPFTGLDEAAIDGILAKRILERSMIHSTPHLSQFLMSPRLWPAASDEGAAETYGAAVKAMMESKLESDLKADCLIRFYSLVPRDRAMRKHIADVLEPHTESPHKHLRAMVTCIRTGFLASAGEKPAPGSLDAQELNAFREAIAHFFQPTLALAYGDEATRSATLETVRNTEATSTEPELGKLMALALLTDSPVADVAKELKLSVLDQNIDRWWYEAPGAIRSQIASLILTGRSEEIPAELLPWLISRTNATTAHTLHALDAWRRGDFKTMLKHTAKAQLHDQETATLLHAIALAGTGQKQDSRVLLQHLTSDLYLDNDVWMAAKLVLRSLSTQETAAE
ncbi:DUF3857 and transglutaminase domain-containing protein [Sulfuriroseicoccus oceanibius]|uniref:DUF3857 and transglutaminase domain-containing protein n=1 Tax=Sulfuriroseicoccus oceanibius TaxID=2707525 RepID=A0A6B3L119_9BACT|nr:DUF3857 and transglutaminase domain-containing protein [Sulfuriroseicoccus oceanibius]QQL44164.1 DUF3857 and transglutaminase domain-containing protein [Sulfuriroseicoccus oceanibius]